MQKERRGAKRVVSGRPHRFSVLSLSVRGSDRPSAVVLAARQGGRPHSISPVAGHGDPCELASALTPGTFAGASDRPCPLPEINGLIRSAISLWAAAVERPGGTGLEPAALLIARILGAADRIHESAGGTRPSPAEQWLELLQSTLPSADESREIRDAWTCGRMISIAGGTGNLSPGESGRAAHPGEVTTKRRSADEALTSREREVFQLMAQGLSDRQIAECLEISPSTVSTHVKRLRAKLGGGSRTAVAMRVFEQVVDNQRTDSHRTLPVNGRGTPSRAAN